MSLKHLIFYFRLGAYISVHNIQCVYLDSRALNQTVSKQKQYFNVPEPVRTKNIVPEPVNNVTYQLWDI